ncbi:uncharacterized protein LOC124985658 [Sciurus carolinensis]|uniref:uncharacterized protein LOC124985658 n=1 Tax=Sciurus carolinensis TaxID=30640 RepID=UPI001FB51CED|nr:uncharacterized protein LOC124985658 [Sciurus carolinensis]
MHDQTVISASYGISNLILQHLQQFYERARASFWHLVQSSLTSKLLTAKGVGWKIFLYSGWSLRRPKNLVTKLSHSLRAQASPESIFTNHSILEGTTLTLSSRRQNPLESSWSTKFAQHRRARVRAGRPGAGGKAKAKAKAKAARRPRPGGTTPPLPRACPAQREDGGCALRSGRAGDARILSWKAAANRDAELSAKAPAAKAGGCGRAAEGFWNAGCGPLPRQKRNESACSILTNKHVHCRLRRNFPFLIYIRLSSLSQPFFFKPLTTSAQLLESGRLLFKNSYETRIKVVMILISRCPFVFIVKVFELGRDSE